MIEFLRSLFGLNDTGSRTVVGGPVSVDVKDVHYIKDSNLRISALHNLLTRYKGTAHEAKLREVYTKSKDIHIYLVHKKRVHELELFHLQNTDHFLNTFTAILDVHQKYAAPASIPAAPEAESYFKNLRSAKATVAKTKAVSEAVKPAATQMPPVPAHGAGAAVQALALPDIAIDTSSRILYLREDASQDPVAKEIGFTSALEEKEAFLTHIAARLGIQKPDVAYIGNTMLALPSTHGPVAAGYVPVINWRGKTYAVSLNEYRLFPVRVYRRSL